MNFNIDIQEFIEDNADLCWMIYRQMDRNFARKDLEIVYPEIADWDEDDIQNAIDVYLDYKSDNWDWCQDVSMAGAVMHQKYADEVNKRVKDIKGLD